MVMYMVRIPYLSLLFFWSDWFDSYSTTLQYKMVKLIIW